MRCYSGIFATLFALFVFPSLSTSAQQLTDNPFNGAYRNRYGKLPAAPSIGDRMIANWVHHQTVELSARWSSFASSLNDWEGQRAKFRQQLFEMLGLDPMPERTDLKATVTGMQAHPEFTVENVHYQSRPGLYCTANVYIPKNASAKSPAILYLCGHGAVKENGISYGNKVHYQHHGAWFARNGYVCMVLDSVQLGEIEGKHHGTHHLDMWWWNSRGFSAAGPEAWNCIRALDYLQTRPDVDPEKLGVTGRSGGGAYSWWVAALDERIKAACPVAGITDLQNHAVDGCVEGHCDCMYMVNTYRWDYSLVAALVAPRPLLICNTDKDNIFPIDGVMRLHANVRNFYDYYNAPEKLGVAITEGGHVDTQEIQVPVMRWFNKWLKNSESPVSNHAEKYFTPQQLRVFEKIPADEITSHCYDSFTPLAAQTNKLKNQSALEELRTKTFGAWPDASTKPSYEPKLLGEMSQGDVKFSIHKLETEPAINLRVYLLQPSKGKTDNMTLLVLDQADFQYCFRKLVDQGWGAILEDELKILSQGKASSPNSTLDDWLNKAAQSNMALVLITPRGTGVTALGGDPKYQTQVRRRSMLLGSTIASGQVWDVIQAMRFASQQASLSAAKKRLVVGQSMSEVGCFATIYGAEIDQLDLAVAPRDNQHAADFLNWARIVTPEQLLEMAANKTRIHLSTK